MRRNLIDKTFTKQLDQSDCGVACLLSILKYHGGNKSLENLREISGTSKQGTTLLGLYQAAQKLGFEVEGYEGNFEYLQELEHPVIQHVIIDKRLLHYVVCYGFENGKYIIGDPGRGIMEYTEPELSAIWQTRSLLELLPTERIEQAGEIKKGKWNWFRLLLREDISLLTIIFIVSLVLAILGMVMAIFSQKLIDDILPSGDVEKLAVSLVLVAILLAARGGIGYIAGFFGIIQGKGFNNRLIGRFFNNLLHLPKSFFDTRHTGELVERMNDTSRIQNTITAVFGDLLKNFLLVITGEVILFIYSPTIGMLSMVAFPLFGFISWRYHKRIVTSQQEVMASNAHKSGNYVNSIQGIDAIKGGNKEEQFSKLNQVIYGIYQDKIFSLGKVGISLQLTAEIASVFITITLVTVGSWMVIKEKLTIGSLMALLGISGSVFPAIVSLSFANITLQGAKVAFDRMYEFSSIPPEFEEELEDYKARLTDIDKVEVKNVSFRFPGRKQLLKGVSLQVSKGEIIALLGESGCGKTTFLNILQRFYAPEEGEIFVNEHTINEISIPAWRKQIGIVPQEVKMFNGTLIENICLGATQEEIQKCVDFCMQTGFHQFFTEFPQNYGTLLGEQGINISGGQKQLVGLARALWSKPSLLILDEPTSAMDRNTENFVMNLLNKLKTDICILLVTHRIKITRFSDRIYILEKGQIHSYGNHLELMGSNNLYSASFRELMSHG
ncbi:peptidase domain-containing ABC transporter [Roseimarinus sediminis]|uniref:peptidase domain-containing ABC transporter n=1 Tax=Roseimarinus sediminis TaxID=1610899 RepID=UPI003D2184C8